MAGGFTVAQVDAVRACGCGGSGGHLGALPWVRMRKLRREASVLTGTVSGLGYQLRILASRGVGLTSTAIKLCSSLVPGVQL